MQLRVCTFRVRPKRSGKGGLCSGALSTMGGGRREGGLAMAPANYSAETYSAPEDCRAGRGAAGRQAILRRASDRSEEHTSELQSRGHLVCRLLLEKKKNKNK